MFVIREVGTSREGMLHSATKRSHVSGSDSLAYYPSMTCGCDRVAAFSKRSANKANPEPLTACAPGSLSQTRLSTISNASGSYIRTLLTQKRSRHETWIDRSSSYGVACDIEGLTTFDVSILQSHKSICKFSYKSANVTQT